MIKGFADKDTERVYNREIARKLPRDIQQRAREKLVQINNAKSIADLRFPPGNGLHALKENRKGQHAIRINQQWRVCFKFEGQDAFEVGITDYH